MISRCKVKNPVLKSGTDFVLICTNTMHKQYDTVQRNIQIPILHIADATAEKIKAKSIRRVTLLATRFTMEENFYKGRLVDNYGLDVSIPPTMESNILLSAGCLERPGTKFCKRTGGTFRISGDTCFSAKKDKLKTEIIPVFLG